MPTDYTAQIQCRGEWWIGWIREVSGVTCQERTREELLETLRITLLEVLYQINPICSARSLCLAMLT